MATAREQRTVRFNPEVCWNTSESPNCLDDNFKEERQYYAEPYLNKLKLRTIRVKMF